MADRVDGIEDARGDREKWSSWLIPGGESEYKKISSPELQTLVRSLARRPDELTPAEKLSEFYDQLEKLESSTTGDSKQQILEYMDRIAKRSFDLSKREEGKANTGKGTSFSGEVPSSPEAQRKMIRELLEKIEQNDVETYHFQNVNTLNEIQDVLPKLDREVRREANARLKLQDCSIAMRAALSGGGDSRDSSGKPIVGGLFREKFAELNAKGRLLDGEDLNSLFHFLPGINVGMAYMELQKAALLGKEIRKGKIVKIFEKGSSEAEQKLVYQKIVNEMGGGEDAEKAVQLAMRFAWASLEVSVWNDDLLGVDPVAEAIYLRQYREGRAQQGKDRGPEETVASIEGFGSSFLRTATLSDRKPFFDDRRVEVRRGDVDASNKFLLKIRGVVGRATSVRDLALPDPRNIDFSKTDPGTYGLYMSVRVPQILALKSLLLKDDWSPTDMLPDSVRSWLAPMEWVDNTGILNLRYHHINGALGSAFSTVRRAIELKWEYIGFKTIEKAITETLGTTERGVNVTYLSKEQWNQIIQAHGIPGVFGKLVKVDFATGALNIK